MLGNSIVPQSDLAHNGHTARNPNKDNKIVNQIFWTVSIAVSLVALGSFSLSFMALYELAIGNGIPRALGWIWPLIVDVSMVIYTAAILVAQLQRRGARLPIGLTIFYAVVTVTGNILHAPPTPLGWFVASLPPLSLILGTEMLRTMGHHIILQRAMINTLAELNIQVDTRKAALRQAQADLDKLDVNIEQAQAELERLQKAHKVLTTVEIDSTLRARQIKAEQDSANRESRLTTLVDILQGNPKESVKRLAQQLEVSRTTIYNDLSSLESQGVISKNGRGWKVTL